MTTPHASRRISPILFALLFSLLPALPLKAGEEDRLRGEIEKFFDRYNREILAKGAEYETTIAWVEKQSFPTAEFKRALAKLYRDSLKKDPDMGYGADALICGQDYPKKGCRVKQISIEGSAARASLESRDPSHNHSFQIQLVKQDGMWRLDGTEDVSGGLFTQYAGGSETKGFTPPQRT